MIKEEQRTKLYLDVKTACDKLGYTIVSDKSDFINNQSVIKYICPFHGLQEKSAIGLKQEKHCALCANKTKVKNAINTRFNNEVVRQKYYSNALDICAQKGYTLLSRAKDFKGYKSYIEYKCEKHGIQRMRYGNLKSGRGCPKCKLDYAHDEFVLTINEVLKRIESHGGRLLNVDDYYNSSTENLMIECPRCHKNIVKTSLKHFTQHGGKVCSDCFKKESNGERAIREWLEKNSITFEQQKWFPDCKDIKPLPFDFYIDDGRKIIEFDGKQHFEDTHFFNHYDKRFDSLHTYIKYHDNIKTNYCKENGIKLLRIPYNKINEIDRLLSDFISA